MRNPRHSAVAFSSKGVENSNWEFAALVAGTWNTLLVTTLAVPVAAFKLSVEYFWYRVFDDGRVETEFDLDTGQPTKWGLATPPGLEEVGWRPMTPELLQKIIAFQEFGVVSNRASPVTIKVSPDDDVIIARDGMIIKGALVKCKSCQYVFRSPKQPEICPACGIVPKWKCDTCNELYDTVAESQKCELCGSTCRVILPFFLTQHAWEEVTYLLGIRGKYLNKFTSNGLITVPDPDL